MYTYIYIYMGPLRRGAVGHEGGRGVLALAAPYTRV